MKIVVSGVWFLRLMFNLATLGSSGSDDDLLHRLTSLRSHRSSEVDLRVRTQVFQVLWGWVLTGIVDDIFH